MAKETLLKTTNLTRDYGAGRGAIGIDIEVRAGQIVGFIGPNGAGKTTTMRLIMGFSRADAGSVELLGQQITHRQDLQAVVSQIGFLPGETNLYGNFTPTELFNYTGKLLGRNARKYAAELGEMLDIPMRNKIKYLSLGNKRKVGIVHALLHNPKLLILDEPTSGLDPLMQQKVLTLFKQVAADGGAVFLSSHVLSEVQQICERIVMIKQARIIMNDATTDILAKALKKFFFMSLDKDLLAQIGKIPGVKKVEQIGQQSVVYSSETGKILELLAKNNVYDFYLERTSLEEMFLEEYEQS